MGIEIVLQNESGQEIDRVSDFKNLLLRMIQSDPDPNSQILMRFIDPYGDTVFNRLQMEQFISELQKFRILADNEEQVELLLRIQELAQQCKGKPHLYIKMIGD